MRPGRRYGEEVVGRRTVQEQLVAPATIGGRDHPRCALVMTGDVADEAFVEDGVHVVERVAGPLPVAPGLGALRGMQIPDRRGGDRRIRHGQSSVATGAPAGNRVPPASSAGGWHPRPRPASSAGGRHPRPRPGGRASPAGGRLTAPSQRSGRPEVCYVVFLVARIPFGRTRQAPPTRLVSSPPAVPTTTGRALLGGRRPQEDESRLLMSARARESWGAILQWRGFAPHSSPSAPDLDSAVHNGHGSFTGSISLHQI